MNTTTYIIDDEEHAVETLSDYVAKTDGLILAGRSTDPVRALPDLTGGNPPDLVFLDVGMPGMSGLELAGLLPRQTDIIFVTSFREFGVEAFALSAADYLLKPISYARFFQAVQKVKDKREASAVKERGCFFVKGDVKEKYVKVVVDDIIYIAAAQNYVEIRMSDKRIITYLTMSEVLAELPPSDFLQIHRSYIISRKGLVAVENGQLRMKNNQLISIGKTYQEAFSKWFDPNVLISKRLKHH
ncbi:MAG: LytTR family DNA-binding domain-containing protein [Bacteroidota bacterium]